VTFVVIGAVWTCAFLKAVDFGQQALFGAGGFDTVAGLHHILRVCLRYKVNLLIR
jgi:hypothetical protein